MAFAAVSERRRLLLLAIVTVIAEVWLLPGILIRLLVVSAEWPVFWQLLLVFCPRFIVMLALVLMFGPFRTDLWLGGFVVGYLALQMARFHQSEVFVDWTSTTAASRALLPYAAGIAGTALALWVGRRHLTTGARVSTS